MPEQSRYRKKSPGKRAGGNGGGAEPPERVEDAQILDARETGPDGAGAGTATAREEPLPDATPEGFPELPTDPDTAPGILHQPRQPGQFPNAPSGPALVTPGGRPVARLSERDRGGPGHATEEEDPWARRTPPPTPPGTGGRGASRQTATGEPLPTLGKVRAVPRQGQGQGQGQGRGPVLDALPRPPMYDFSPDPAGFFKYWASMPPDRTLVYVYRNWPVCDPMLLLTPEERTKVARKEMRLISNIGKLNQPWEPKHWEQEIYHRFGSGDYHFKLNDLGSNRAVCMVSVRGLRDFENYPPVLDKRSVVMTDPANSSYVERMRLRGMKFPGDPGAEEEDMEMNGTSEAMRDMAQTVDKLTDRILRQPVTPPGPDARSQGELRAVEAVAEGAKRGIDFMSDAMKTVAANQAHAQDPKAYLEDVMATARMFAPPAAAPAPDPNAAGGLLQTITGMFGQMLTLQAQGHTAVMEQIKERLTFAERLAADATQRAMANNPNGNANASPNGNGNGNGTGAPVVTANGAAVPARPPSMLDELEKLLKLKDRLDDLGGGKGGGGGMPGWVPYALQGLNILATAGTNIAYNLAASKSGVGAIPPPPMPQPGPGAEGEFEDEGEQPEPQHIAAGAPGTAGVEQMNGAAFAQRLHGPLVKALNDGVPGYEFAARMILHEGAMVYHYLAGQGKDGIVKLMQQYQPLWQDVIRYGAHVETFLNEFLDRDQAIQLADEMKAQAHAEMMPPPPPPRRPAPPRPRTGQEPPRQSAPPTPPSRATQEPGPAPGPGPGPRRVVRPDGQTVEVMPPEGGAPTVNAPPPPRPSAPTPPPTVPPTPPEG